MTEQQEEKEFRKYVKTLLFSMMGGIFLIAWELVGIIMLWSLSSTNRQVNSYALFSILGSCALLLYIMYLTPLKIKEREL